MRSCPSMARMHKTLLGSVKPHHCTTTSDEFLALISPVTLAHLPHPAPKGDDDINDEGEEYYDEDDYDDGFFEDDSLAGSKAGRVTTANVMHGMRGGGMNSQAQQQAQKLAAAGATRKPAAVKLGQLPAPPCLCSVAHELTYSLNKFSLCPQE